MNAAILAVACVASALGWLSLPVADNDLWGHLVFGRQILDAGVIPSTNGWAYTCPDAPWTNHEVLAEIVYALVYAHAGIPGLQALRLAIALGTLALVAHATLRRTGDLVCAAGAVVLVAMIACEGFLLRPQLFSFVALAVLVDRLNAESRGEAGRTFFALPILFVLWVNAHGGVLAGLGVASLHALDPWATPPSRRRRLAVVAASTLALFANPYGFELLRFLAEDVLLDRPFPEWWPIPFLDASNLTFKAIVVMLPIGLLRLEREDRWEVVAIAFLALQTFLHVRHMPLFAVLAGPAIGRTLLAGGELTARLFPSPPTQVRLARSIVLAAFVLFATFRGAQAVRLAQFLDFGLWVDEAQFPVETFRFLEANGLGGNVAVPFNWGEYAIWHLPPGSRVSIDGRYTTAYPTSVIDDAWRYMDGEERWDVHLQHADLALATHRHRTRERLAVTPGWTLVHEDRAAAVFARTESLAGKTIREAPPPDGRPDLFP